MIPIVGRERELSRTEAVVRRGLGGEGALLFFTGEPGIGKTRLADHAARAAASSGAVVAWGRCWEAGGAPPYWPFIEVFRGLELPDPFATAEAGEAPADARFRVFDRAARDVVAAARARPLTIVLDDLHAADVPSLHFLHLLARSLRGVPLVLVGTYRDVEARRSQTVGPLLAKIAREGELVALDRLLETDIEEWLRREGGDPARAAEVHRVAEGNPLFVQEILRVGGSLRPSRLPDGIGAVLDEHLARVSAPTRTVLECGAILGREFAPAEVAQIAEIDLARVVAALAEAEAASLVAPSRGGRHLFVHMLLRDRLVEELPRDRALDLHRRAGESILASRADLVTAAHHFIEGHAALPLGRVLDLARDAAERSLLQLAFEEAASLGERALALAEGHAPSREICALEVVVAEAHLRGGALEKGRERCVGAARLAKELRADDLLARAALAYGAHFTTAVVDPVMVALLEDALAVLPPNDHPIRARVMARLAAALVPPTPETRPRVAPLANEAVAMARRLGDPETLLHTLLYSASALGFRVTRQERGALVDEIIELARRIGTRTTLLQILGFKATQLLEEGRRSEAASLMAEYDELLTHFPQTQYRWRRFAVRAVFAAIDGDFEAASAAGEEIRRLGEAAPVMPARVAWALLQIALAHSKGDPSSIAPIASAVLDVIGKMPTLVPYAAWVHAAIGNRAHARDLLTHIAGDTLGFPWLIAAGDAVVILGDADLAALYYPALLPENLENRLFWGPAGAFTMGPTPRTLGDLALILGKPEDALRHYEDAIGVSERIGSKPFIVLSKRGRERAVAALGRTAEAASPAPSSGAVPFRVPVLRREGDVWCIAHEGAPPIRLKDGKGLHYLERLLASPGLEVHVLDLVGATEAPADAGPVLDAQAKAEYKKRLEDLRDQLEEATRHGDPGRARRAQDEIDRIADALAAAVGLGGRDRKAASNVERARINVQRRLRDVLDRITELDPALGRFLEASIRTGTYCSFSPP